MRMQQTQEQVKQLQQQQQTLLAQQQIVHQQRVADAQKYAQEVQARDVCLAAANTEVARLKGELEQEKLRRTQENHMEPKQETVKVASDAVNALTRAPSVDTDVEEMKRRINELESELSKLLSR